MLQRIIIVNVFFATHQKFFENSVRPFYRLVTAFALLWLVVIFLQRIAATVPARSGSSSVRGLRIMVSRSFAFRRIFAIFSLLLLAAGFIAVTFSDAEAARRRRKVRHVYQPPAASMVFDAHTGRVLHAYNPDALRHPASITKVMTLYLLFEQIERGKIKLDTPLRVSSHAALQSPSKLGLQAGETIDAEDAIRALVTKSANDTAVVVAEAISGDEETFAELMTRRARALGMSRTTFKNASGLPDSEQVTTARDLITLGRAIHDKYPRLYRYFATREFEFAGRSYRNHNKLLGRIEGVDGIKTGYTRASGFNLLTSAKSEGRHVFAVVLGGRSGRSRDAQMAWLVENNIQRAYAGRRIAPMVAEAEIEEEPALRAPERPRQALALVETPAPAPVARPRLQAPAVEERAAQPAPLPPVRVTAAPIAAAAVPLPAMRWLVGPQPVARGPVVTSAQLARNDAARPVPPASVPYTNTIARKPVDKEDETAAPTPRKVTAIAVTMPAKAAEKPAAPKPQAAATTRRGWIIQLAAADSEGKARDILERAKTKNRSLLADAEPFTERVSKGDATLYRARFAGFDSDDAQNACKALKRNGFSCFVQRI